MERTHSIETAAVLSDEGVADAKLLSTVQRHFKYKLQK
jgi:hypothetical protein